MTDDTSTPELGFQFCLLAPCETRNSSDYANPLSRKTRQHCSMRSPNARIDTVEITFNGYADSGQDR